MQLAAMSQEKGDVRGFIIGGGDSQAALETFLLSAIFKVGASVLIVANDVGASVFIVDSRGH